MISSAIGSSDRLHGSGLHGSGAMSRSRPSVSIEDNPVKILTLDDDIRKIDFDGPENQDRQKRPSFLSKGKHIFKKLSR